MNEDWERKGAVPPASYTATLPAVYTASQPHCMPEVQPARSSACQTFTLPDIQPPPALPAGHWACRLLVHTAVWTNAIFFRFVQTQFVSSSQRDIPSQRLRRRGAISDGISSRDDINLYLFARDSNIIKNCPRCIHPSYPDYLIEKDQRLIPTVNTQR